MSVRMSLSEKFADKFIPEPMSGCWLWHGAAFVAGYGYIIHEGRKRPAHRVSYELHNGPIPDGMLVRHTCDNKACVNPQHLLAGTSQDNSDDCVRRGRIARNEACGRCKLSNVQVAEIRRRRANGELLVPLAKEFGVTHAQIRVISLGLSRRGM
jgi:hypothetical protein